MKNLRFLSFALLFWVLVLAWCEKTDNQEKVSCEGENDVCPIEQSVESPSIEIEQTPTVIVDEEKWDLEWDLDSYVWWDDGIVLDSDEATDEPMMRKMVVDENATAEEIEQDMVNTCANAGWIWADWVCTLEDGSEIAF